MYLPNTKCKKKKKVYIMDILLKQTIQSAVQVIKVVWNVFFFQLPLNPGSLNPEFLTVSL